MSIVDRVNSFSVLQLACAASLASISWLIHRLLRRSSLHNVPGPVSTSFIAGNLGQLFNKKEGTAFFDHLSRDYEKVIKFHGNFGTEQILVYDPLALYHILVKDQHIYPPPNYFIESLKIISGGNGLLNSVGQIHRNQRKLLAPAFSAAAVRNMCPIFYGTAHKLKAAVKAGVANGTSEINVSHWMSRTALQLIGAGGLGHSFDELTNDDPTDDFARCIKLIPVLLFRLSIARRFFPLAVSIFGSGNFSKFLVDTVPWPALHRLRDALHDQYAHTSGILRSKKLALIEGDAALAKQVGLGKDIMSIFLRENMDAAEDEKMQEDDILAQMTVITIAGTDTTSSAISRVLHLLAQNPNIQQNLREELVEARVKADGKDVPYDDLSALPYLDAICRETLRLYSPVPFRERTTAADAILPLSKPIVGVDGKEMREIHVPKGTSILLGISSCNRDPDIWGPDADEWKPERWLSPLPASVASAHVPGIYSNLLTFFGGQRACIGFKFSQLEMKVVLALMIESFQFDLPVGKEIMWNFAGVTYPSILGDDGPPAMPLQVTAAL